MREFAQRFRQEMVPLSNSFSYFTVLPLGEEDVREYLREPVAALPPALLSHLGKVSLVLVPYLEKPEGSGGEMVSFEKPVRKKQAWGAQFIAEDQTTLVLAVQDEDVADCHYVFYRALATVAADHLPAEFQSRFSELLREELRANVHGEVDERGWEAKQELLSRQATAHRETKLFRGYARQAFVDTLTLYLHGICCDIDVETGPRQLASRHLRRRLQLLQEMLPPPQDYTVFPEEQSRT